MGCHLSQRKMSAACGRGTIIIKAKQPFIRSFVVRVDVQPPRGHNRPFRSGRRSVNKGSKTNEKIVFIQQLGSVRKSL